jgi:hypothetical protein
MMKFLIRMCVPTETGNKIAQDDISMKNIENYLNHIHAEAAYFFVSNGERNAIFIVNIDSVDMLPRIAEPLFQEFNAKVDIHPVMNLDELKKGYSKS